MSVWNGSWANGYYDTSQIILFALSRSTLNQETVWHGRLWPGFESFMYTKNVSSLRPFCLGMWVKPLVSYNNTSWPLLMSCQSPLCRQLTFRLTLWHWFLWHHVTFFLFVGILFTSGIFKWKYITIRFRIQLRIGSTMKTIVKSDSNSLVGYVDLILFYCARSFKKKISDCKFGDLGSSWVFLRSKILGNPIEIHNH